MLYAFPMHSERSASKPCYVMKAGTTLGPPGVTSPHPLISFEHYDGITWKPYAYGELSTMATLDKSRPRTFRSFR